MHVCCGSFSGQQCVRTYIRIIRPHAQAEIDWFARQLSLNAAIEKAALAINSRGKRYSHQRRLKKAALEKALGALLSQSRRIANTRDFDALFRIVDSAVKPILGTGELYVYDTALRIGAKMNLFPAEIYLHASTRQGARALGLDNAAGTVRRSALPREFHVLKPHELEDVLCIFKNELKASAKSTAGAIVRRNWCE